MEARRQVLLVDDDSALLRILERQLKPHHDVTLASSVEEALQIIGARVPEVVISDFHMEPRGGAELMDIVAKMYPHVRLILYSAEPTIEWGALVDTDVVQVALSKPATVEQILAAIGGPLGP